MLFGNFAEGAAMPDDLPIFLASIGLFVLYLFWSAGTEMGTQKFRWPGKK